MLKRRTLCRRCFQRWRRRRRCIERGYREFFPYDLPDDANSYILNAQICEWGTSHLWKTHVIYMDEWFRGCKLIQLECAHNCMRHDTFMNESCHTCAWVISQMRVHTTWVHTYMYEARNMYECVMSHMCMGHLSDANLCNVSAHIHVWGTAHLWLRHVIYIDESFFGCECIQLECAHASVYVCQVTPYSLKAHTLYSTWTHTHLYMYVACYMWVSCHMIFRMMRELIHRHTHGWVMLHTWMKHVIDINESYHRYGWVISTTRVHTTRMYIRLYTPLHPISTTLWILPCRTHEYVDPRLLYFVIWPFGVRGKRRHKQREHTEQARGCFVLKCVLKFVSFSFARE